MCNNLVCKVCGGQGVSQRELNCYSVTLCDNHFNELHCKLQEKKPREAMVQHHTAIVMRNNFLGMFDRAKTDKDLETIIRERSNAWMNAEHKYFLVTDGIVKRMKKEWAKKNKKKKTPRPEPSDGGELAEKK